MNQTTIFLFKQYFHFYLNEYYNEMKYRNLNKMHKILHT